MFEYSFKNYLKKNYWYSKSLTLQAKVTYMKSEPIDVFIATPGAFKKFLTYGRTSRLYILIR